jgi:methylmalonyl-CoA mutase C-terminal domain/subunit
MADPRIRVVLGKVGLDGHDRGAKVIARGLRDAGMEVIYTGLRRTPEELATIVLQEDAQVVGLSMLSGGVVPLTKDVRTALDAQGLEHVAIFVGGIVSPAGAAQLADVGVTDVFGPGTKIEQVAVAVRDATRRGAAA